MCEKKRHLRPTHVKKNKDRETIEKETVVQNTIDEKIIMGAQRKFWMQSSPEKKAPCYKMFTVTAPNNIRIFRTTVLHFSSVATGTTEEHAM